MYFGRTTRATVSKVSESIPSNRVPGLGRTAGCIKTDLTYFAYPVPALPIWGFKIFYSQT